MKKLCVIGNSHVAFLKSAWGALATVYPDVELTFFAAPGGELRSLQIADGVLIAGNPGLAAQLRHTSGGQSSIDFRQYDAVMLCGLSLRAYLKLPGYVSRAAQAQAITDHVTGTMFWSVLGTIRKLSEIPVHAMHNPLLARPVAPDEAPRSDRYDEGMALLEEYGGFDQRTTLLRQPAKTIYGGFYTNAVYAAGAPRLDGEAALGERYTADDPYHMNSAFGQILLKAYLPAFRAAT